MSSLIFITVSCGEGGEERSRAFPEITPLKPEEKELAVTPIPELEIGTAGVNRLGKKDVHYLVQCE